MPSQVPVCAFNELFEKSQSAYLSELKEQGNIFKFRPRKVEKRVLQREEAKAGAQRKMPTKESSAH